MSTQYAGADVFPADYTIPDDGESIQAAAVNVAFEALGDRTKYNKLRADTFVATYTPLADLSALKAITTPTDGMVRIVERVGLYTFRVETISPFPNDPWLVAADDATAGTWYRAGIHSTDAVRTVVPQGYVVTETGATRDKLVAFFNHVPITSDLFNKVANGNLVLGTQCGYQWCIDSVLTNGALLESVSALVKGHTGTLPTRKMSLGVFRSTNYATDPSPGSNLVSLASAGDWVEDPSANGTDYGAWHEFHVSSDQNYIVDRSQYSYYVQLWGGVGEADGALLRGLSVRMQNYVSAAVT